LCPFVVVVVVVVVVGMTSSAGKLSFCWFWVPRCGVIGDVMVPSSVVPPVNLISMACVLSPVCCSVILGMLLSPEVCWL